MRHLALVPGLELAWFALRWRPYVAAAAVGILAVLVVIGADEVPNAFRPDEAPPTRVMLFALVALASTLYLLVQPLDPLRESLAARPLAGPRVVRSTVLAGQRPA